MAHRFKPGDLAVTINSRVPLLNNGHVVRIIRVMGAMPDLDITFGYEIERLDGLPFVLIRDRRLKIPVPGDKRVLAHHWQLRRLVGTGPTAAMETRTLEPEAEFQP